MVLRLKPRKSRSPPDLQKSKDTNIFINIKKQQTGHVPVLLYIVDAGWSSPVARQAHNLKVVGSNPTPATTFVITRWKSRYNNTLKETQPRTVPP